MIFEHRTYTLHPGGLAEYLPRYEQYGLPIQKKYLGRLLGFFVSEIGELEQVVHIWAYDSHADREERRRKMEADPEWAAFRRGNRDRGTFVAQEVKILRDAPFCPHFV
ncbi:MAG: NIPSNAP family protein [Lautropia sp.]